jgi:cobalt/nickel transport system ATP-binding protein
MAKKVVEIKNLNYSYPDGTKALSGISLDVFEGESVGIIGPNGAGKSTLLLHLNGILKGNGHIRILGLELNGKNLTHIRSKVGLVFQDPDNQLFMPTVFDDVAFGPINMSLPRHQVELCVKEALKEVDMLGAIGRSSHHLSFGEKKRVSVATVLAMKPEVLILDEPSSNLDPRARRHLIKILKGIKTTRIISGHDLELILDICDRAIVLDKGKMVGDGYIKEVLSDKSLMESHGLEVPLSLRQFPG